MRTALALLLFSTNAFAADAVIDLMTRDGVAVFQGVWRYSDTRIFMSGGTYDFEPHAGGADFDDSTWEILDPPSLDQPRSTGKVCFNWYRIRLTVPESMAGMTLVFDAVVDDYAEVWVNGELPRDLGQSGGSVIKGFNAPNRLIIARDAQPGQKIQIAVFGINGPISDAPGNFIFFRHARIEVFRLLPERRRGVRGN